MDWFSKPVGATFVEGYKLAVRGRLRAVSRLNRGRKLGWGFQKENYMIR